MPDQPLHLLLDQNIPRSVVDGLRAGHPTWRVTHVQEIGLNGAPDPDIFRWAQVNKAVVITYDEDFADTRSFQLGTHHGIVRLRVWPTTTETTAAALDRLFSHVVIADLVGGLAIVDNHKIRLRRKP